MASKKRPIITIVDARPMDAPSFQGHISVMSPEKSNNLSNLSSTSLNDKIDNTFNKVPPFENKLPSKALPERPANPPALIPSTIENRPRPAIRKSIKSSTSSQSIDSLSMTTSPTLQILSSNNNQNNFHQSNPLNIQNKSFPLTEIKPNLYTQIQPQPKPRDIKKRTIMLGSNNFNSVIDKTEATIDEMDSVFNEEQTNSINKLINQTDSETVVRRQMKPTIIRAKSIIEQKCLVVDPVIFTNSNLDKSNVVNTKIPINKQNDENKMSNITTINEGDDHKISDIKREIINNCNVQFSKRPITIIRTNQETNRMNNDNITIQINLSNEVRQKVKPCVLAKPKLLSNSHNDIDGESNEIPKVIKGPPKPIHPPTKKKKVPTATLR